MKKLISLTFALALTICLCTTAAFAADGSWLSTLTYPPDTPLWITPGNWGGGTIAGGLGSTAYFTNGINATPNGIKAIMATGQTIENMEFSLDADDPSAIYVIANGTVTLTGSPSITVSAMANVYGTYIGFPGFGGALAGTDGFAKEGTGRLLLAQPNTISGTINVNAGTLEYVEPNILPNADIAINTGAMLVPATNGLTANSITINTGGQLKPYVNNLYIDGSPITIANGGVFQPDISCSLYNDLTIAGVAPGFLGAIDSRGNNQTVNISNITLSATAQIGALSIGNVINLYGDIDGTGNLTIWGQAGATAHPLSFNIYGSNTYSGATILQSASATTVSKLFGPQRFPNNALSFNNANTFGQTTIDLNGNDQQFGWVSVGGPVIKAVRDSAGGGTLKVIVKDPPINGNYVMGIEDGTLLVEGGNVYCEKYVYIRNNASLVVTSGTFTCDLELMPGHAGTAGTVTVSDDGTVSAFVCRNGDTDDASTFNLNNGGTLKTAGMHAMGTGIPETSYLNFDGGTLSDGIWPIWNPEWIQVFTNLIVKAGGANIEVNNASGRTISFALLHDSALGGTPDGGLTKLGPETLILGGNNTYTGPTVVQAGTLAINGSLATSGITIADGAALGGSGNVGPLTVPAGATIAPGTSIGTLNTGALTMEFDSEYDWEVGDPVSADLINVNGTLDISAGGIIVNVIDAGSPDGSAYTLFTATGIVGDATDITMSYGSGVSGPVNPTIIGNDIVANIVPEPATLGLLAILGLAFLRRK